MRTTKIIYAIAAALLLLAAPAPAAAQGRANGRIAFERSVEGVTDILIMNADGTGERNLTETPFAESQPAFSPDGSKIVFVRAPHVAGETTDLYVMDADGHNLKRLTSDAAVERFPSWSPDGTRVAYSRTEAQGGFEQIYTVTADGFELKNVTAGLGGDHSHPTWSPDSKRIAFNSTSGSTDTYEIWAVNADGTGPSKLTDGAPAGSYLPAWSPDGTKIAFRRDYDIYTVELVSGAETNLTLSTNQQEDAPAWSPDGTRLVFARYAEGNLDIFSMKADGTDVRRLTTDPQLDNMPAWAAAATQLAFVTSRDGNREIYLTAEDGTGATRLTNDPASDTEPALSPDGRRVAFVSTRDGGRMLFLMNADGTGLVRLTNPSEGGNADDTSPAWSPDGTRLVFSSRTLDSKYQLYVVGADGSGLKKISDGADHDLAPSWSPDGTKIVFQSLRKGDNTYDIYSMNADGTNVVNLTHDDVDESDPVWSPDGARIAYVRSCCSSAEIYVMNADGSNPVRLTNNTANDRDPAFSPDSTRVVYASLRNAVSNVSTYDLYATAVEGGSTTRLTTNGLENVQPSWSPVGAAGAKTAAVRGRVLVNGATGLAGVSVHLSGAQQASTVTDGQGAYSFANLPTGGDYTVRPLSDVYEFTPESLNVNALGGDTTADFVAKRRTVRIGGRVTDASGKAVAGAVVEISQGPQSTPATAATDADGLYAFTVAAGEDYTVRVVHPAGEFTPAAHLFEHVVADRTGDFRAAPVVVEPARVQFAAASYATGEGARLFNVRVTRAGDASAEGTVFYETLDGTASERGDYTTALGTLRFGAGEAEKSFDVLLTDDAYAEGPEALTLKLSNATGGLTLGETTTATLTVEDNDAAQGPNPSAEAEFFVRQHYHDFLNREPDAEGLRFWADQLTACNGDAGCLDTVRQNVSAAFFLSIEFQQTGYLVHRLQRVSYGTLPRYRDLVRDAQEIGRGVVVGRGDWRGQLEANKQAFVARWAARAEFGAKYAGLSNAQFVDALWSNVGLQPSAAEREELIAGLESGAVGRAEALRRVAESEAVASAEFNSAFVLMEYFGYLRRNPDDKPDADMSGYRFWLDKFNGFGGDFHRAEMVRAFIVSLEYQKRFGQ